MNASRTVRMIAMSMVAMFAVTFLARCDRPAGPAADGPGRAAASQPAPPGLRVLADDETAAARAMLRNEIRGRIRQACEREDAAWAKVHSVADWGKFRDDRLAALRKSLGGALAWTDKVPPLDARVVDVTSTIKGDGFIIQNLVIAARPGLPIAANLYLPDPPVKDMPGILLVTSHHNGKTQGELLDMGMTWARSGTAVLVMDNLGYNERRQHPDSFVPREDYRWRYYLGMQLYTVGEGLMGWIVDDLHRGVDVLLGHAGADPKRVIVMGSVASGGDAAAVLAAFDKRITCSIPFNFGSASARTGADGGKWTDYVGGGDYETTRCLRANARDGFVPWMIVAAAAPRPLIFAKEFAWDADSDPGFARIRRVYDLYNANDKLDSIHGYGSGSMSATQASHASNVGPVHRRPIYPILTRWLNMPEPAKFKPASRPSYDSLNCCLTADAKKRFPQRKVFEIAAEMADQKLAAFRRELAKLPVSDAHAPDQMCKTDLLVRNWNRVLGGDGFTPLKMTLDVVRRQATTGPERCTVEKVLIAIDSRVKLPLVLMIPAAPAGPAGANARSKGYPVVICVSQSGKKVFLARRSKEIAELLRRGVAVCLVDVRGTGETRPAGGRYWCEPMVEIAAEELMTGRTLLGSRLRDLRGVIRYLQTRADIDGARLAVWGESFAEANPPGYVDPPLQTKLPNELAEPLGAHLSLLAALFEPNVKAVLARGGLTGFASLMDGPACHVCLDDVVPGVLETGDLADVAAVLAPRPVRIEAPVDGRNIRATDERIRRDYAPAAAAYRADPTRLGLSADLSSDAAAWLAEALGAGR